MLMSTLHIAVQLSVDVMWTIGVCLTADAVQITDFGVWQSADVWMTDVDAWLTADVV